MCLSSSLQKADTRQGTEKPTPAQHSEREKALGTPGCIS